MQKILVLAANPIGTNKLRLDKELREIKEGLRRAKGREQFSLESVEAVRYRDIHRALIDHEPHIVHFSGHGSGEEGLIFEDETGQAKLIDTQALGGLFELFAAHVKCVLLNACFSEIQAHGIAQHIDYVIGMSQAIGDQAAIEFAVGFYDALGVGKSFEFAYKLGCQTIRMAGIPEALTPKLLTKNQFDTINSDITIPVSPNVSLCLQSNTLKESLTDDLSSERGIDYTRLRDFLAFEKWKEADQETLTLMLKVAHREKEGWLDVQSINDIPCIDLRTIDQLWVKYSKGHFGFSVQQQIWKIVGGELGVFNDEVWINFGERVGWRTTRYHQILFAGWTSREWSDYSQINFNQDTPEGHLPRMWDEWRGGLELSALTLKLENCDIKYEPTQIKKSDAAKLEASVDHLSFERGMDYTRLQTLLASGRWKEADRETFTLLLKIAHRDNVGWLDIQSINNFPCNDLCIIDQLWIKYSNGKFGFSVQNIVWQEVGGKVDIETECRLGKRLSWRVNNKWLSYSDLTFTINAPYGHLPVCWWDVYFRTTGSTGTTSCSLMLKFQKCNIKYEPQKILPNVELKASIYNSTSAQEIDCTRLENFLASLNWKQADEETRLIMLKIAHREKEGWLDITSISNIKSTDLRTINQLWMKYSDGHFGFGVQKSIWQDVEKNEQAFSYRVGWCILGKWVYHHSLTFSLDALPGHLPFWGRGWSGKGLWVKEVQIGQWADALLSHQDW